MIMGSWLVGSNGVQLESHSLRPISLRKILIFHSQKVQISSEFHGRVNSCTWAPSPTLLFPTSFKQYDEESDNFL
eukprot:snap_masked-scaffold_60-processed-gene-0.27-mRNA-1 protein AED:1.00 eAED:1.00 QI:0/0/0/0/1/1/2/0/74